MVSPEFFLQYGHNVEVISPPELRRQVAEEAAAMAVIYEKEKNEKKICLKMQILNNFPALFKQTIFLQTLW